MIYVVLYLVGAILFVDGLTMAQFIKVFSPVAGEANIPLLGLGFSAKGLADLSFAVGGLIAIMALVILSKDLLAEFGQTVSATVTATCFTFVIAYFMFAGAITHIWNPDLVNSVAAAVPTGAKENPMVSYAAFQPLGWYCLITSVMLLCIGLGFFHVLGKKLPKVSQFGVLWCLWAVTFFMFFYVFGLGHYGDELSVLKATGWWTALIGIGTAAYPALAHFNAGKVGRW